MKLRLGLIGILGAIAIFVGYCSHRDNSLAAEFPNIAVGMTRDQVVAIMGRPSWEGKCSDDDAAAAYKPDNCLNDLRYSATMAPIDPFYYVVWLGRNGKVMKKAWLGSP